MFKASDLITNIARRRHTVDRQFGAMVLALCTFTLLQPQMPNTSLLVGDEPTVSDFLSEATNLHNITDRENPTLDTLLTSIHLSGALDVLGRKNAAWLRLQEAITVSEILDLSNSENQDQLDSDESERRIRAYLCLSVIEK